MHVTFQTNGVRMWLDREKENRVVFLLFSCYMWKLWEWFTVVRIVSHTHTCWVRTFSCLFWERAVHSTIVLIPTEFLLYVLVSNCYLVTIFFIPIICEKFEFTLHTHLWSFANIIVLCRLGSILIIPFIYPHQRTTQGVYMSHQLTTTTTYSLLLTVISTWLPLTRLELYPYSYNKLYCDQWSPVVTWQEPEPHVLCTAPEHRTFYDPDVFVVSYHMFDAACSTWTVEPSDKNPYLVQITKKCYAHHMQTHPF